MYADAKRRKIAALLERVFCGPDHACDAGALEKLGALGASPLALRMQPELLRQLEGDGFGMQRFVANVLKGFRINHARARARLLAAAAQEPRDERAAAEYARVVLELGHLVEAVLEYGYLAEAEIDHYLDARDTHLNAIGAQLLDAIPALPHRYLEQILRTMARNGPDAAGFGLGPALAGHLDQNPAAYGHLYRRFEAGNENLKANILRAFGGLPGAPPPRAQQLMLQAARDADGDGEFFSQCIIALGACRDLRQQAIAILAPQLNSGQWYIRGNAAVSLARLDVDDARLIAQIGELALDTEGFDWWVCSASVEALTLLGSKAKCAIPQLLAAAHGQLAEDDCNGYPSMNALLARAFEAIGDNAPEVIEALRKIVARQGFISAFPATLALGTFGSAALPALGTIGAYLFGHRQPGADPDAAARLVGVLAAVAGHAHPITKAFIAHLEPPVGGGVARRHRRRRLSGTP